MKAYYVSKIIGTGTEDDPYRPKVADHGVSWAGSILSRPDGKPLHPDCLVVVEAVNHAPLRADPDIDAMPDASLDLKVSSINTATKNGMINKLRKRGFATQFIDSTDGYRDVIHGIGRQRDPDFDVANFDVE
jgi:hypothetical protein